jgi:hypothetical protein
VKRPAGTVVRWWVDHEWESYGVDTAEEAAFIVWMLTATDSCACDSVAAGKDVLSQFIALGR